MIATHTSPSRDSGGEGGGGGGGGDMGGDFGGEGGEVGRGESAPREAGGENGDIEAGSAGGAAVSVAAPGFSSGDAMMVTPAEPGINKDNERKASMLAVDSAGEAVGSGVGNEGQGNDNDGRSGKLLSINDRAKVGRWVF